MLPDSYARFREQIRTTEPGTVSESLSVHIRRDGSPFHVEVRRSMIQYRGRPCVLSVVRDVSQRIQTEQSLGREIEARMREQATLLAISHTLASTLEFQPGLILDQLREIIEYTHGGLFVLEDSTLVTLSIRGTPSLERNVPFRIHLQGPETLSALFNGHRPIRIADIWSDHPPAQFLRSLLNDGAAALLEGMQSWMWVPLAVRGRIIGGMGIADTRKNYFTAHDADLALRPWQSWRNDRIWRATCMMPSTSPCFPPV
jgi:transcriptional regulator with GAF, ATPase, and Fis domain